MYVTNYISVLLSYTLVFKVFSPCVAKYIKLILFLKSKLLLLFLYIIIHKINESTIHTHACAQHQFLFYCQKYSITAIQFINLLFIVRWPLHVPGNYKIIVHWSVRTNCNHEVQIWRETSEVQRLSSAKKWTYSNHHYWLTQCNINLLKC